MACNSRTRDCDLSNTTVYQMDCTMLTVDVVYYTGFYFTWKEVGLSNEHILPYTKIGHELYKSKQLPFRLEL